MESLQNSIDNLNSLFQERMSAFESKLQNSTGPPTSITVLAAEFSAFRDFIADTLKNLQLQVQILARNVDHLEMQGRRKVLLLHGVKEEKNEELIHVVAKVVQNQVKLDNFTAADIKRCHRIGKPSMPHKHRPIFVKMQHVSIRDKLWFEKTKLKGSGITISEFLTKARHDIFMAAREKYGVTKCWTREGSVYVLGVDGKRQRITSLQDIHSTSILNPSKPAPPAAKTEPKNRRAATSKK